MPPRGRAGRVLIALRILRHIDTIGLDDDRAFGRDHVAGEDVDLLQVVIGHVVRFDVQRLVVVGAFGVRGRAQSRQRQRHAKLPRSRIARYVRHGAKMQRALRADGRIQVGETVCSCSHT